MRGQGDWASLFRVFDSDGSGAIDQTEFLKAIRGNLSAYRLAFVQTAFGILDCDGSGVVEMHEMRRRFKGEDGQPASGDDLRELMRGE